MNTTEIKNVQKIEQAMRRWFAYWTDVSLNDLADYDIKKIEREINQSYRGGAIQFIKDIET